MAHQDIHSIMLHFSALQTWLHMLLWCRILPLYWCWPWITTVFGTHFTQKSYELTISFEKISFSVIFSCHLMRSRFYLCYHNLAVTAHAKLWLVRALIFQLSAAPNLQELDREFINHLWNGSPNLCSQSGRMFYRTFCVITRIISHTCKHLTDANPEWVKFFISIWNVTGDSASLLPRRYSYMISTHISQLLNIRSYFY